MKKIYLLLFLFILFKQGRLSAQCSIEQLFSTSPPPIVVSATEEIAQSFEACITGELDSVKVKIFALTMANLDLELKIHDGYGTSNSVLHSQMVSTSSTGELVIPINSPLVLIQGNIYTFSLTGIGSSGSIEYSIGMGDEYTGGNLFRNNIAILTADLFFGIYQGQMVVLPPPPPPPGPPPIEPIPTLSEWGLLILSLVVLNFGVIFIYKQEDLIAGELDSKDHKG